MDAKIKLLNMIQDVIKRMANNSFMLKAWTVTLITAIIALDKKSSGVESVLVFYIPVIMFWVLDSYYLQMERKFRVIYHKTANSEDQLDFTMSLQPSSRADKTYYYQCLFSKTELVFYIPLAILTAILSLTFGTQA